MKIASWLSFLLGASLSSSAFAGDVLLVNDSSADRVFRCVDLNNDGDYNDLGEVVDYYDDITGAFSLTNNNGIVCVPGGPTYISDATERYVLALRDTNNDGDALDPGEASIFFDGRPGGNADGVPMTSPQYLAWDPSTSSFFVATANTGTAGSLDEILRLRDNNADGDANDLGEVVRYWTAPAGAVGDYIPEGVGIFGGRVYYVEIGSTGVTAKGVYALIDNNNDGDAQDPGERVPFFVPPTLTGTPFFWSIEQDPSGWFYLADTGNDVIWRFKDLNNDGDAQDPGEFSQWYVVGAPSTIWDIAIASDGTLYTTDAQSPERISALRDANNDGLIDPTEVQQVYNSTAGGTVIALGRGIDVERPLPPGTPFCSGDGSGTACPCGNNGSSGNGCANSVSSAGGRLDSQGVASIGNDTLVLLGSGMPSASVLYFQGTAQIAGGLGATFGDGLRCVGGTIIRLNIALNVNGESHYPDVGDPSVSIKGVNSAGSVRNYQIWYRNSATFCTSSTFNLTNGVSLTWAP